MPKPTVTDLAAIAIAEDRHPGWQFSLDDAGRWAATYGRWYVGALGGATVSVVMGGTSLEDVEGRVEIATAAMVKAGIFIPQGAT